MTQQDSAIDNQAYTNAGVLESMKQQGADMTRPVHHIFYFNGAEDFLRAAAIEVENQGLRVIQLDEDSMLADTIMKPDLAKIEDITKRLAHVADAHNVFFDGWEAEVRLKGEYNLMVDDGQDDDMDAEDER